MRDYIETTNIDNIVATIQNTCFYGHDPFVPARGTTHAWDALDFNDCPDDRYGFDSHSDDCLLAGDINNLTHQWR